MKFSYPGRFWRQRGDCCIFFEVVQTLFDDGETAEIVIRWCRQLDRDYRVLAEESKRITAREYQDWTSYYPRGEAIKYAS